MLPIEALLIIYTKFYKNNLDSLNFSKFLTFLVVIYANAGHRSKFLTFCIGFWIVIRSLVERILNLYYAHIKYVT